MRLRQCKMCGTPFPGAGEQRFCDACRKTARRESVMRNRECLTCGKIFLGGPRAAYCPDCREERRKSAAAAYRARKAAGKTRRIGSIDICRSCGKEYVVTSSLQMYCPDCAPEEVRNKVLQQKRARAAEHREEASARKKQLRQHSAICAYCGSTFTASGPSVTCSEKCAREHKRIVMGMADYRRGRRKKEPSHDRYDSGLPQSELAGVTYNRRREKWEVRHKGRYIGIYQAKEDAEAKKLELIKSEEPPE